jgi:hypothetical protein
MSWNSETEKVVLSELGNRNGLTFIITIGEASSI